ncbi:MAG: STAS/SEC14 domain-containing protein [Cytophagales bacterium]|nr:MAG: STAS/SEC14 domain-containing protein [Cytophagales bacterium]
METENNYLKVQTNDSIAIMEWLGLLDTIDYRKGHQDFLQLIEKNENALWLLNYKESENIINEDQDWTVEEWLPKAIQAVSSGVKKIAVIVAKNIFNRISVRIISTYIQKYQVDIAFFNDELEAKAWLLPEKYADTALSKPALEV